MQKNEKKVAVITGGSQGIGRCIAEKFAGNGYATVICARTEGDVKKASAEIGNGCEGVALDVSDSKAVSEAFSNIAKRHGRIDVLVTCAGIYGPIGTLEENDAEKWEQALMINLCGTVFCVRAALPVMKKQNDGCIITLAGGGAGGAKIKPNFSSYVTSKFAVAGFTEAVSKELEGTGVRINAISPGAVNTRLLEQVLSAGKSAGKEFLEASKKQKQGGGTPPELSAKLALFLASDKARNVSGRMLSAVWDKEDEIAAIGAKGSLYTLRRIDDELFSEKKK